MIKKDTKFNRILWYFWTPGYFEAKNIADEIFNRAMDIAISNQDFIAHDDYEFTCGDMVFYFDHRKAVLNEKNPTAGWTNPTGYYNIDYTHLTYFTRSRIDDFVKEIRRIREGKLLEHIDAKFNSILKSLPPAK